MCFGSGQSPWGRCWPQGPTPRTCFPDLEFFCTHVLQQSASKLLAQWHMSNPSYSGGPDKRIQH